MPKRNNSRTVKGKGRRDAAVRSMTSSAMSGATSIANSTINRDMKRSRTRRINRGKALSSMASSMASGMSSVGKMAYDTGMPLASSMAESVGKSVSKKIREYEVPRVSNMGAWVDLRYGLITGLTNLGVIESESELPTNIYFQSVKEFLKRYSGKTFSDVDIRSVTAKVSAMDPDDDGDVRTMKMPAIFKDGVDIESIIKALEYEFRKKIESSTNDMDMDIEPEPEPGQGFQYAKEKTKANQKYNKVVELSKGIEILMGDSSGKYDSLIRERLLKLKGMVISDKEKKALTRLLKMYPELEDMLKAGYKREKSKRRKRKKTGKRGRKRTGRR